MKAYRFRRLGKHPDVPLGAMQLCFSLQTPASPGQSREDKLPEEWRALLPPADEDFLRMSQALTAAYGDLGLRAAYTVEHGYKLERLFLRMRERIQDYLALWKQSDMPSDHILWQGRRLYRALGEALVAVRGVCGLCATHRHMHAPTDSFWQLVECVRSLRQDCQKMATFFATTDLETFASARHALSA